MSTLYVKVTSDIRAGMGCKASEKIQTSTMYSFKGGREQDGSVDIEASFDPKNVVMVVSASSPSQKKKLIAVVKFLPDGTMEVVSHENRRRR